MYEQSGFQFDISEVVYLLHLRVRRKHAQSYDIDCPFCGENKGKLNVNLAKNVFRCNRCGESGGMLDLYAKLYGVTTKEANQQILEALNRGEFRDDYQKRVKETPAIVQSQLAPEEAMDQTYSQMLSMLTLSKAHQEHLLGRGLTGKQISELRYRSVPLFGVKNLVEGLIMKGCTIKGVPGFYQDVDGRWTINFTSHNSGILIPIVSMEGKIQGFQIRVDHVTDDRKYIWLSSVNYNQGVSSGSPVHVIGNRNAKTVYLTEGALKGTIAHYLSGDTFVCVAGVNQYRNLKPVLEALQKQGTRFVIEAYDMDKKMQVICDHQYHKCGKCAYPGKQNCHYKEEKRSIIQKGCRKAYEICKELSLPMSRMLWDTNQNGEWNGDIKGIDDLYVNQKRKESVVRESKP